jgi:hypothetical protein
MWPWKSQRRPGKASTRNRKQGQPRRPKLFVELLEERTVLSTISQSLTQTFAPSTPITQFTDASNNTFLGSNFSSSGGFGSIDHESFGDFGVTFNESISGKSGLNIAFTGTGGQINPSLTATLAQGFTDATGFGQVISFNPQNTNVSVGNATVTTTSPAFGYGVDLVTQVSGTIGGEVAFFDSTSGSTSFGGTLDLPLFAVNENNSGEVDMLGFPVVGASTNATTGSQLEGAVENFFLARKLFFGVSNDPPLRVKLNFNTPAPLVFNQDLQLQLGLPNQIGPYLTPAFAQFIPNLALDLGSVTEEVPHVDLSTTTVQPDGSLTASGSGTIAQMSIQAGAVAGSLLGLGALGTTISAQLGAINLQFTPISFQIQPTLSAAQTVTLTPVSRLTYSFIDPADPTGKTSMSPDVVLNGVDLGSKSSVTFTPGKDTLGVRFEGKPIGVVPSWDLQEVLTNEVDLDADMDATLTVGQLAGNFPGVGSFTTPALYQQQFQYSSTKLGTLFDNTSTIYDSGSTGMDSFTIGANFVSSTVVKVTTDNASPDQTNLDANGVPVNNSLRDAIEAANKLNTPTVIQLGAGTYNLTLPPLGTEDGSDGDLLISKNITIRGAGAGQTVINANFSGGKSDRLFHVANGGELILDGVTLENGNPANSNVSVGVGGAILEDAGGELVVLNSAVTNNTAAGGNGSHSATLGDIYPQSGAINAHGLLIVRNSSITNNTGGGQGAGIYIQGGTLDVESSTISNDSITNSVNAQGGGVAAVDSSVAIMNSTIANDAANGVTTGGTGQGNGGGLFVADDDNQNETVLIVNSTFYGNQALSGAGEASGGGLFLFDKYGTPYLLNDTVYNNISNDNDAGITADQCSVVMKNTIVAGNFYVPSNNPSNFVEDDMFFDTVDSAGNNLIGSTQSGGAGVTGKHYNTTTSSFSSGGFDPTDLLNMNPGLGGLADNGGPTLTQLPNANSPVLGAGGTTLNGFSSILSAMPLTDQRGYSRTSGGKVDIGAVQYQYDLSVTGSESFTSSTSNVVKYTFTVTNNGPDAANNVTFTDAFPAHNTFAAGLPPTGWNLSGSNGSETITATSLAAGSSATFSFLVGLTFTPPQAVTDTATVTPTARDTDAVNNSVTLTVYDPTEGQPLQNAVLFHFDGAGAAYGVGDYTVSVNWGDTHSNTSGDGTGTVAVVVNPNGGFDVIGSHTYADEGHDFVSGSLTLPHGAGVLQFRPTLAAVADGDLTAVALTPPTVGLQTNLNNTLLFHFLDPALANRTFPLNTNLAPIDFNATVQWGDGTSNSALDGSHSVAVYADPAGGFDVVGTHAYASNVVGAIYRVHVVDFITTSGPVFDGPTLFHFTDADPSATGSDFTPTVHWGDGSSNTVSVVADPGGGFDLIGSHSYTTSFNGTFSASVADDGGATVVDSVLYGVDYPLTAGTLTLPSVTTEGQSISNALLFHFTDGDTAGKASDFTATVLWGDGTSNTSADNSGSVSVALNTSGGIDVYGSHTFDEVSGSSSFAVAVQDTLGARTGAAATGFTVSDPSVSATGGFSFTASEDIGSATQTVATFTDSAGAEALGEYAANVHWGDGSPDSSASITYNSTTHVFSAIAQHTYAQAGSDTITVTISHGLSAAVSVTDTATVAEVAVNAGGNAQLTTTYGQSTGNQMVATFTDPGTANALSGYQATINWGDGTGNSSATVGYDTAHPFTYATNVHTGNGPTAVAVADVNGDGNVDLVVADATDHAVQVFLGNGDGTFQAPATYSLGTAGPSALVVADLGNGHPDIVTANTNTNTASVLLNNGSGSFTLSQTLSTGASPDAVAVADLDGDHHPDIVTANRGGNNVSVFFGSSSTTFGAAHNFAAGTGPSGVAIGDVNEDNTPDIVVADAGSNKVSILLGAGNDSFQAPTSVNVGLLPSAVALAHLTSSGHLDIVTANAGGNDTVTPGNNVSVLLGHGDGTFATAHNYSVGTTPVGLLVTDVNGDGHPDIVTANNGSNNVSVLTNSGSGTFGSATNYALSTGATGPGSIAAGNLNGASALDLVTANNLSNDLTLLLPPFAVKGSHSYAAASGATPYALHVTVNHGNASDSASVGSATVNPAKLTITAGSASMTYGGAVPTLPPVSYSGLVNGDTSAAFTVGQNSLPSESTTATSGSSVGSYSVSVSGASDPNYTISYVPGTLTINPATLTVTAQSVSRDYGTANPTFTPAYSGFVNGDTSATVSGTPTFTTAATQSSAPGNYDINVNASALTAANYIFSTMKGTLTVNGVTLPASGATITATAGAPFNGTVATFTNEDPYGNAKSYIATINWGDGSATTTGTVTGTGSTLTVTGFHIYADAGSDTVTVTINHKLGYTKTATPTSTATVSGLGKSVTTGLTGSMGFWGSKNGQALIGNFGTTAGGQSLADWLATTFPNLYGSGAGSNNLSGDTNAQVASFYLAKVNQSGSKAEAQVLAEALNVFATSSLLGGSAAKSYGFTVSTTGLGALSYSVGQDGAAFGVSNNTTLNVFEMLMAVNKKAGTNGLYGGNSTLQSEVADLFQSLNQAGSIG